MEASELVQFIGNVGIPGAVCFIMLYMFYKVLDRVVPEKKEEDEDDG